MILNTNQLRVFFTVAKLGSMTLAAQELMVTPQAVSKQLKALQELLEVQLLYSEGSSIKLTGIGSEIYQLSKEIFDKVWHLEKYIEDLSSLRAGVLRIGYSQTTAKYLMPQVISLFEKEYPQIKIIFQQGFSLAIIKDVLDRKTEIAFIRGIRGIPNNLQKKLEIKEFKNRALRLIASPTYPIADEINVGLLAKIPLLIPPEGSPTRSSVLKYFSKHELTPNIVLESHNVDIEKELVRQGKGLCFVPGVTVHEELKNKTLKAIRIVEGHPEVSMGIVYAKGKSLSPAALAFIRVFEQLHKLDFPPD